MSPLPAQPPVESRRDELQGHSPQGNESEHQPATHGVITQSVYLKGDTTLEKLVAALGKHLDRIVRAKGSVRHKGGIVPFDFVHGSYSLGEPVDTRQIPCITIISNDGIPYDLLTLIGYPREGLRGDPRGQLSGDLSSLMLPQQAEPSLESTLQAINALLEQYPPTPVRPLKGLVVTCDADIVWGLAHKDGVSDDVRLRVLNKYLRWRIKAATLAKSRAFDDQDDIAICKYRVGMNLVWHLYNRSEDVEALELTNEISALQPARLCFEGMGYLQESAHVPRLTDNEEQVLLQIFRHGIVHEGLTADGASRAARHAASMDTSGTWNQGLIRLLARFEED